MIIKPVHPPRVPWNSDWVDEGLEAMERRGQKSMLTFYYNWFSPIQQHLLWHQSCWMIIKPYFTKSAPEDHKDSDYLNKEQKLRKGGSQPVLSFGCNRFRPDLTATFPRSILLDGHQSCSSSKSAPEDLMDSDWVDEGAEVEERGITNLCCCYWLQWIWPPL